MKKTQTTQLQLGELRLCAIDVGYELRAQGITVNIPAKFSSVGLDLDGEQWLIEGTREEMVQAIRDAGYTVIDSTGEEKMMENYGTDAETGKKDALIAYAQDNLTERRGGLLARAMPATRVMGGHEVKSEYSSSCGGISTHTILFANPEYGNYIATVSVVAGRPTQASWDYDGVNCEVNGVVWRTREEARIVRKALADAGISHQSPGTKEARKVLEKAGVKIDYTKN